MRILLLGFGNVGRAFCELLHTRRKRLLDRFDLSPLLVGVATRTRGCVSADEGISIDRLLEFENRTGKIAESVNSRGDHSDRSAAMVAEMEYDLLVECTSTNISSPGPATEHITVALQRGKHVVTSNKGPLLYGWKKLCDMAERNNARFLYEATVMAGTPFFSFIRECLRGADVVSFEGVVNGTCNYMLELMNQGSSLDEALLDARRRGFTEPDPAFDIEGWDSAVKALIVAQAIMGYPPGNLSSAEVSGIRSVTSTMLREASRSGGAVRLIARVEKKPGGTRVSVGPEIVSCDSLLSRIRGASNGALLGTDSLGEILVAGGGAGPVRTAFALMSDMVTAAVSR